MAYTGKITSANYENKMKVEAICPILFTYNLIAGRWTSHVLWALRKNDLRFGEIRKAIPLATERMIARRVSELLDNGLIETFSEKETKFYRLTESGHVMLPVLQSMMRSGQLLSEGGARTGK